MYPPKVHWALRRNFTRAPLDFQVPGAHTSGPPRALKVYSSTLLSTSSTISVLFDSFPRFIPASQVCQSYFICISQCISKVYRSTLLSTQTTYAVSLNPFQKGGNLPYLALITNAVSKLNFSDWCQTCPGVWYQNEFPVLFDPFPRVSMTPRFLVIIIHIDTHICSRQIMRKWTKAQLLTLVSKL